MDSLENYNRLKERAIHYGMSLFGVANLEGLESEYKIEPESVYKGLTYGISMGYHLSDRVLESIIDKPTQ
ncbi:MAG: Epoxyqueuosine reductase, partial [Candidatus Poribacteria bacterium]|nr:Epoxyqueuosine reductase [Candidatus Poribacteria bacterium]